LKVMVGMDAETREKLGHSSDRRTLVNFARYNSWFEYHD
jgi:hypothetical protein